MAQEPNIELVPADLPRVSLPPAPARRWSPSLRPGMIQSPEERPVGPAFGVPGPDTGYALLLVARADIPECSPELEAVLAALMAARASHFGRAPTGEDLEVALALAGLGDDAGPELAERRRRWVEAVAHEPSPGRTAAAEVAGELVSGRR